MSVTISKYYFDNGVFSSKEFKVLDIAIALNRMTSTSLNNELLSTVFSLCVCCEYRQSACPLVNTSRAIGIFACPRTLFSTPSHVMDRLFCCCG